MVLGRLTITSQDSDDIVFIVHVENNDANYVNQQVNRNSFSNPDNIRMTDLAGADLSLTQFLQKFFQLNTSIDAKKNTQLNFNFTDSGVAIAKYDLKIGLIYEEDEVIPYEEAAAKNDLQRNAAQVIADQK